MRPARVWNQALILLPKMPTPISTTIAIVAISNPYSRTSCPVSTRKNTITCRMNRHPRARRRQEFAAALRPSCRNAAGQTEEPLIDVGAEDADADQHHDRDGGDQQAVLYDILTVFFA